jgi:hypothetical protein
MIEISNLNTSLRIHGHRFSLFCVPFFYVMRSEIGFLRDASEGFACRFGHETNQQNAISMESNTASRQQKNECNTCKCISGKMKFELRI